MRGLGSGLGRRALRAVFGGAALLGLSHAQFFRPSFQNYQTYAQRTVGYVAATVKPVFVAQAVAQATRPAAAAPTYLHPLSGSDIAFKGQPTQQRRCAEMANRTSDQRQMAELCRKLFQTIEKEPDFRRHNLASGLTVLIGVSLQISRGEALGEAETDLLLRGMNDLLIGAQTMKGRPADLQAMYESALMTGGLILAIAQQGADDNDPELAAAAKALAGSVLQTFGVAP